MQWEDLKPLLEGIVCLAAAILFSTLLLRGFMRDQPAPLRFGLAGLVFFAGQSLMFWGYLQTGIAFTKVIAWNSAICGLGFGAGVAALMPTFDEGERASGANSVQS